MRTRTPHSMRGVILLTVFAAILATLALPAPTAAQQRSQPRSQPHDLDIPAGNLAQALHRLGEQAGMQVVYDQMLVEGRRAPAVSGSMEVDAALARLLAPSGLTWQYANGKTIVLRAAPAEATASEPSPTGTLTGRVTQAGEPVAGATVTATSTALKGPRVVTTDDEGNYDLTELPAGKYSLRFELEGLVPVVKEAEVAPDESTPLDIQMSLHEFSKQVSVASRLRTTPIESAMPTVVITREEIERSGATSIAQVLSQRPEVSVNNSGDTTIGRGAGNFSTNVNTNFTTNATTIQLRGLTQGTTLVLVNGRRVGGSAGFDNGVFDLSTLPLALVERIEILPFGASAIYGGDGLAGVVNIVLKQQASGFDVRTRYNFADGYANTEAGFTWGTNGVRGALTVTGNYSDTGALTSSERSLTADRDFTRFGGLDTRNLRENIYSLDGCPPEELCTVPLDQRGNLPGLNAPVAAIPIGQDGQNLTPEDFLETAGLQNRSSDERRIFSPANQSSLSVNGRYQVSSRIELFGDLVYTRRDVPASELPLRANDGSLGAFVVPATNPFNPFGVDVGVEFLFSDTDVFVDYDNEYVKSLLGVRGEWGRRDRRWSWEVASWLSEDQSTFSPNLQNGGTFEAINAALASPDPATALNPFRTDGGPLGSPSVMRALFIPAEGQGFGGDFGNRMWGANGYVRGPVFQLPAGPVEGLLGGEYQHEALEFLTRRDEVDGASDSRALFGELRIPLLERRVSERRELLALTGAVRIDNNNRFEGRGTTQTLGLEWRPRPSLLLRASYSNAFKPLTLFSASEATTELPSSLTIVDPQMGGQTFVVSRISGGGVPPELKPETSTTRSLGLVFTPMSTRGARLSLTAWDSRLRDRLVSPGGVAAAADDFNGFQFLVNNEALFPERVIRDPQTGVITAIDGRQININFTEIAGVDLALDGSFHTSVGDFSPSLGVTYTYKYDEQVAPTVPLQDNLAVLQVTGWAPRWKLTPRLGWDYRDWLYTTLSGRYISAYEDPLPLFAGPEAGTFLTLGDFWLVDLNLDFALGRWLASGSQAFSETRLSIGAVNLLNQLPDFCNSCFGYDATQYDIRGRVVSAELRINF